MGYLYSEYRSMEMAKRVQSDNQCLPQIQRLGNKWWKSRRPKFPVVFLAGTGKGFNMQDLNDTILMHQDIGLGPKYINYENRIEYNTLAKEAIRINSYKETLSEEMRILYVALTRAKERLIITGLRKDAEKALKDKEKMLNMYEDKENKTKINPLLIKKYKSYLDWLELVYLNNKEKTDSIFSVKIHKKNEILKHGQKEEKEDEQKDFLDQLKKRVTTNNEDIIKKLKWKYEYIDSILIPTKTSVTKIKELENENISSLEETAEIKNIQEYKMLTNKPKFLNKEEKITSSKKGTLMHLCVQKMNEKEEYNIEKLQIMVDGLCAKNIITENEKEAIQINKLYEYTKSSLWNELKSAKEINKEKPFYINILAKDVFEIDTDETILVQGIIDLYYINKNNELILVDFKTDYIKEGEEDKLVKKYNKQLEIYKKALESSLKRKVVHTYIFSMQLNKLIEL